MHNEISSGSPAGAVGGGGKRLAPLEAEDIYPPSSWWGVNAPGGMLMLHLTWTDVGTSWLDSWLTPLSPLASAQADLARLRATMTSLHEEYAEMSKKARRAGLLTVSQVGARRG